MTDSLARALHEAQRLMGAHLKIVHDMREEIISLKKKIEELEREKNPSTPGSAGTSTGL